MVVKQRIFTSITFPAAACLVVVVTSAGGVEAEATLELDHFEEALHLRPLPEVPNSPQLFLARFEFNIRAPLTSAFRADQFDAFPKPLGKLLNAHRSIEAFEATLTRGRWKSDHWGSAPREFRPPGAVLVAALRENSKNETLTEESSDFGAPATAFRFLVSTLAGTLCASFEGMDPSLSAAAAIAAAEGRTPVPGEKSAALLSSGVGARPLGLPADWATPGQRLRLATLPYEPVCTENLTPFLKLLPCGRHRGLGALLASMALAVAESPLTSLSLAVAVDESQGTATLRASLDVVLPGSQEERMGSGSLESWLKAFSARGVETCSAAASSEIFLRTPGQPPAALLVQPGARALPEVAPGRGQIAALPISSLGGLDESAQLLKSTDGIEKNSRADQLSVMRDMLSQDGRSERTHGRYLLRLTNQGRGRRVLFMDQLPFFIRPLWHTIRALLQETSSDGSEKVRELVGVDALSFLGLQLASSDGSRSPTELSLSLDLLPGSSVSIFLDVLKNFIHFREFSFSCEKGFDVGGAVWLEKDLVGDQGGARHVDTADFLVSLGQTSASGNAPGAERGWRLHFTEGMLVMLPMPDFSMPFNVIALSSTAVTFFFGSVFRVTAAGRLKHWSGLSEKELNKKLNLNPVQVLLIVGMASMLGLSMITFEQLVQLKASIPEAGGYGPELVNQIIAAKEISDGILAKR